ncbi:hypothetical protein [Streptomyces johnsoniae]|uniref:Uncharacterized protein n=1 Tax=Streptomyces johnsoniae TaxID=3075532 RepID=A0ABU2RZI5_9ACTN|nr:hypothetical protein [Streptomyces sp. DSM 41886]MDT0441604.1 hypothetical protein [Streptomyces sp. DSM 41886]
MNNTPDRCATVVLEVRAKPGKKSELKSFIAGTVTRTHHSKAN